MTKGWDDRTDDTPLKRVPTETITKVRQSDPCRGEWCIDSKERDVRVDRSSLATVVLLESRGSVIEDAQIGHATDHPCGSRCYYKVGKPSYTLGSYGCTLKN